MTAEQQPKRTSAVTAIAFIAVLSIVSGLGGLVKLPSPVGSVAFDSAPGFFAAVYLNPWVGGAVGCIGHLLSAASAGFPAGVVHLLIAAGMFVCCWSFGAIARQINRTWGLLPAAGVAIIINNLIPFGSVLIGVMSVEAAIALIFPFLLVASSANVTLASLVILVMRKLRIPGI